jgi:hypothetical protein
MNAASAERTLTWSTWRELVLVVKYGLLFLVQDFSGHMGRRPRRSPASVCVRGSWRFIHVA